MNVAEEVNVITVLDYANASKDLREKLVAFYPCWPDESYIGLYSYNFYK
jgi:hypothetical protein